VNRALLVFQWSAAVMAARYAGERIARLRDEFECDPTRLARALQSLRRALDSEHDLMRRIEGETIA
jgi:hypothetical protein